MIIASIFIKVLFCNVTRSVQIKILKIAMLEHTLQNKSDNQILIESHQKNFQYFDQAES